MRVKIAKEGVAFRSGWLLEPGSLLWNDTEAIPVTMHVKDLFPPTIVAKATDVRRESDGTLTAWLEGLAEEFEALSEKDSFLTFFGTDFVGRRENGLRIVETITIRELTITEDDPWKESNA